MTFQANDIAHLKDEVVRIVRVGDKAALIRRYGGDRIPMGYEPIKNLKPSTRVTILLDEQDVARLREIRRLTFAANEDSRDGWGVTSRALGAHLRSALEVFADNYCDEFAEDELHDANQVKGSRRIPFRVRMPTTLRDRLFAAADDMRRSLDDVARAAIVQQIMTCYSGGVPYEAMDPALRLCVYPPRADNFARETLAEMGAAKPVEKPEAAPAPETPVEDNRVSVDVLAETIAEQAKPPSPQSTAPWAEDGDGIRSTTSAAALPVKPKIRPEDILAMRPLKPPSATRTT